MSILYNIEILEKVLQSIRKKSIFRTFFRFFRFWTFLKSEKKRVNGPKKTSISTFFHVFRKMKAYVVRYFYFLKTLVFFAIHLGPFCVCGAMLSRHFDFSKSRQQTGNNSARFFWPHFHPLGYAVSSFCFSKFQEHTDNKSARFFWLRFWPPLLMQRSQ